MSPELEILDQLLGGDLPLSVIRRLFPEETSFSRAVHALLREGDVQLLSLEGTAVPQWRWRELFEDGGVEREMSQLKLSLTEHGARRIS